MVYLGWLSESCDAFGLVSGFWVGLGRSNNFDRCLAHPTLESRILPQLVAADLWHKKDEPSWKLGMESWLSLQSLRYVLSENQMYSRSKKCGELVRLKSGVENTKRFATINQPSGQLIVNIFLQGSSSVYVHSHWETHLEVLVTRWPHCEDTQERIGIALDQEMGTKGEGHIGASMAQEKLSHAIRGYPMPRPLTKFQAWNAEKEPWFW